MTGAADVPSGILSRLRAICVALPHAYEEDAWLGTRWRVRGRTFAHVLTVEAGRPPAYARAAGTDGPVCIVTFHSAGPELDALRRTGPPFFAPPWGPDVIGLRLGTDGDGGGDWDEIAELITESFCVRAPARLAEQVDRPPG